MAESGKHDGSGGADVKSSVRTDGNTVGTEATKLASKPDDRIEAREIQGEADKEYFEEIEKATKAEPACHWREPFFVVVQVSKPGYLINVVRRRFYARQTLPNPEPDQTVWRYNPKTSDLTFLWSLPDLPNINQISASRHMLAKEDRMLGEMVIDYLDKRLYSKHATAV